MVYMETIEASKTWECPKSGVWKIICVGGGGAGYAYYNESASADGTSGGTTSFGSYVSANGGTCGKDAYSDASVKRTGTMYGFNGFNGATAYGEPSPDLVGVGYGASGGAILGNSGAMHAGLPGNVISKILDLTAGAKVACTVGAGGTGNQSKAVAVSYPGRSGAIIVQYLGESM